MKLDDIRAILEDTSLTLNQKAANLEAAILKASTPSALNIQPMKTRKKREAKTVTVKGPTISRPLIPAYTEGADDHGEAH